MNLTGIPSLSVPMRLDNKGLPVGMQFIGDILLKNSCCSSGKHGRV
ncbi:hypothetical protein NSQ77_08760 [Oceanobacillus sp. FSL K6-2867]